MDINKLREAVVSHNTRESRDRREREVMPSSDGSTDLALAIVYLGDCIREGTSDIGPAINKLADELRLK